MDMNQAGRLKKKNNYTNAHFKMATMLRNSRIDIM